MFMLVLIKTNLTQNYIKALKIDSIPFLPGWWPITLLQDTPAQRTNRGFSPMCSPWEQTVSCPAVLTNVCVRPSDLVEKRSRVRNGDNRIQTTAEGRCRQPLKTEVDGKQWSVTYMLCWQNSSAVFGSCDHTLPVPGTYSKIKLNRNS